MDLPPSTAPDFSPPEPPADAAALLEALPWGVLVLDGQGVIQRLNKQAAAWCGIAADAALGQPLAKAPLPPALGAALRQLPPQAAAPSDVWLPTTQQWLSLRAAPAPAGQRWVFLENATARHQAEAAQQRSSQLLLDMEAVALTGSYEADLVSGGFYFSDGLYRLFGEVPQAFVPTLALIDARSHPADAATVRQVLDDAVQTKQPYTYRRRIRRADGAWRTLEAHGEVVCDAAGQAVQLRGLVQDVTERVQAEQALRESHELLRRTIDSSLDMVQVFEAVRDEQGAVVDFTWVLNNDAAEQVYGDVIGQRLCQLNPGVVPEGIFDTFKRVLATGVPDQSERHYVHEQFDGWFYQSTVKLGDGVTTTTHDITARKRTEQALRESKTLLQDIIDAPHIGLAVCRAVRNAADAVVDFTHDYINRASREMLGEDFTGKLFTDHGDNGRHQLAQLREVLETGQRNSYLREADFRGRRVWFAITNTPLDGDRLVHTWEDVTARQQAEAEIIRLKEAIAQQATDKYRALFRSMDQGFCVLEILFDATGQQAVGFNALEVNPKFAQESGMAAYAAGHTAPELVPALDDFWLAAYGQVVRTGEARRQERYEPRVNRWFDVHAFRIGPAAAHQVAVLFTDISARKQVEQRQDFLLALNDALRPLAAPLAIAATACRLLVEHLAASRAQYVRVEDEPDTEMGVVQGEYIRQGQPMPRCHRFADYGEPVVAVLRTGQPLVLTDTAHDARLTAAQRAAYAAAESPAAIAIPLVKAGRLAAVFTVHHAEARDWTAAEVALAGEVAERTWAAVERARAEEALAASEEKFRAMANLVPDLLWRSTPDSDTTWYNQRWHEYTGQTLAEAAGYGWTNAIHPDDRAASVHRYRTAVATGQPLYQEHRIRSAQGEYRWFQVQAQPLRNEHGEVTAWFGAATDIHARKLAELRLRYAAEADAFRLQLADALGPLADAVAMQEAVTRLARQHFRADRCYYCEISNGQAIIRRDAAAEGLPSVAGTYPLADFALLQAVVEAGRPFRVRDVRQDATVDETLRQLCVQLQVISYLNVPVLKNEQPAGVLCLVQSTPREWTDADAALAVEVAERTWAAVERGQAEAALAASEEKYRTLFDSIDEGFALEELVYDANGEIEDIIFREVNQAYERQGGLTNVVGKSIKEVLPNLEQHWKDVYAQVARTGQPMRLINHAQDVDRWFDTYLTLLAGSKKYVAVVFNDITERKRREQHTALLADISNDLSVLSAPDDIMQAVGERLGVFLGATACLFADVDEASNEATVHHGWNIESVSSLKQTFRLADYFGEEFRRAGRAGEPSIVGDTGHDPRANAEAYAALGIGSFVTIPFQRQGRWVANITITSRAARAWRPDEIGLLQEIAARAFPRIDRTRAELALAASEQRLRALVANLPGAAAFVVGRDLRYQLAGGEALDAAGLAPADLLGRTVAEAMPPELVPQYEAHYRQALAGQGFSLEHTAHGHTFISRGVPLLDAAGQPEAVLVVSYDISARKQAEEALRLSEEKFRTLADTAPALIWFNNERGENQFVNQYFLDYVGHQPASVRGLAWHTLLHPDDAPTYLASYQQAVQEQRRWQRRSRMRRHDGAWHWFENYAKPLFDDEGCFLGHVGISADVTAMVRAQEALQVSETKYRTLFETMDQGFGIGQVLPADEATGAPLDWQWLEVNPQLERLTGLARTDVLSQPMRQLVPGLEDSWYERYAQAAAGETVNFEVYSPVLERWFDVYAFALGPPANRRVAVLFSNTSEQKQLEAALREAEARYRAQLEQQVAERTQQLQASRDLLQSVFDTSLVAMSVMEAVRDDTGAIQDFRLRLVSQELERETGRTDLVGRLYAQEYPGIRQVGLFDLAMRALETGEPQGTEYYYPHEGFFKWFICQFVKLGDGLVATSLDITERKNAEQERLRNLRLLEQAEAVAGLGSWDYDLATGVMRWSEGMYHLVRLPLGQPVSPAVYLQLVDENDRPRAEQLVRQLTAGQSAEETLRLRVGEQVKTVRLKTVVLRNEAGQPTRVLGVDLDISELQRLEADNLRLRLGQQQALFEAVQEAQEAERRRMSESLHNGIGQVLYATKLQLDRLPAEAYPSPRHRAAELLSEAIRQTRALSHELTPAILEEYGLEATLHSMCSSLSTPALRWHCHFVLDEGPTLPPLLQLAVYRLAQELAQNVLKHAQATNATLEVEVLPAWVVLRVEDNGRGFDPAQTNDGLGLRTLRSRAALLGGNVQLATAPGQGTQCQVRLPLPTNPL